MVRRAAVWAPSNGPACKHSLGLTAVANETADDGADDAGNAGNAGNVGNAVNAGAADDAGNAGAAGDDAEVAAFSMA